MRTWLMLLGGLLLWAGHFFALYLIAEFWGDGRPARLAAAALTLLGLAANAALLLRLRRADTWVRRIGGTGALLAILAIAWQGLPLLLS